MRYPSLLIVLALAVAACPGLGRGADEPPGASEVEPPGASQVEPRTGEIMAHEVNVRAGAHLNYEILTQLDKGDLVLITGARRDWVRIAVPPGVLVWVSAKYVDDEDGLVEGDRVNARSGPALKYNVLCQLRRDDRVVIKARSAEGEWLGIEPPEAAGAYIFGKYVADKGPAGLYAKWAPRKERCIAKLAEADTFRDFELERPAGEVRFDAIVENYGHIETSYPDLPEARIAKRRTREVERIRKETLRRLAAVEQGESPEAQATPEQKPLEPKHLTAKGVLREISRESTRKGLYRITKGDRWVCIVKSATLELAAYVGKDVQVWGREAASEGWSLRTIDVSRVKLLE